MRAIAIGLRERALPSQTNSVSPSSMSPNTTKALVLPANAARSESKNTGLPTCLHCGSAIPRGAKTCDRCWEQAEISNPREKNSLGNQLNAGEAVGAVAGITGGLGALVVGFGVLEIIVMAVFIFPIIVPLLIGGLVLLAIFSIPILLILLLTKKQ